MANTLKLGSLDLSQYIRLAPGDGYSPAGGGVWLEPGFQDSPLSEGQTLAGISAANKELAVPLYLKADTKGALHNLIEQINNALQAPGTQVEWRDDQASDSTYYTLQFGRLEDDFNYRRAQHNVLGALLRLYVAPYGSTGTSRVIATAAASAPVALVLIPSAIDGDAPAQLGVNVTAGNSQPYGGRMVAISAIPHPSYAVDFPAASMTGGALNGEPYAPGSQVRSVFATVGRDSLSVTLPIPSVYGGLNRVFAVFRSAPLYSDATQPALSLTNIAGDAAGPTVIASGNGRDWQLADLGAFRVASQYAGPSQYTLKLRVGEQYDLSVARVVILPDDKTSYAIDTPLKQRVGAALGWDYNAYTDWFNNGTGGLPIENTTDTLGNTWSIDPFGFSGIDYQTRSAASGYTTGWTGPIGYRQVVGPDFKNDQAWYPLDQAANASVVNSGAYAILNCAGMNTPLISARVMYRMGPSAAAASSYIGLRLISSKVGSASGIADGAAIEARLLQANTSQITLDLSVLRKSATSTVEATRTLLACQAFNNPSCGTYAAIPLTLDLNLNADNQLTARVIPGGLASARGGGFSPTNLITPGGSALAFASVGASVALNSATAPWQGALRPAIAGIFYASQYGITTTQQGFVGVARLIADEMTGAPCSPGDTYKFDGVTNQHTRIASGADVTANLNPVMRGRFPQALPSTAKIAVLAAPIYRAGPLNDSLSVAVTVRERFRYAR